MDERSPMQMLLSSLRKNLRRHFWPWQGGEGSRFLLLLAIMIMVVGVVGEQAVNLYQKALLEREQSRLYVLARGQAQVIQRIHREHLARWWLPQMADTRLRTFIEEVLPAWQARLGETGEILFARHQGDQIQFLFPRRHKEDLLLESIPWQKKQWAEPMRRALQGQGGAMLGRDYRGVEVIAAYEYLPELQLGMVAKIDLHEINAPIEQTAQGVLGTTIFTIVIGGWIFSWVSEGGIRRLRQAMDELALSEQALRQGEATYRALLADMQQTERQLSQEIDRRRFLFEHSRDGVCILGMDGRVLEANAQFARMLGYERQEMQDLYVWDWDVQWSEAEIKALLREISDAGISFVTHHRRKDGTRYTVEVSSSKMVWQDKEMLLSSHRDITLQVQQEVQLRQLVKMEAIGTLAGGVAHDFNNILSVMLGFAELAMKHLPPEEQPYQDVQEIFRAGLRARDLVSQLLAFSRRTEQQIAPLTLDPLVKEVVKFLRAVIPDEVSVVLQLAPEPVRVMADAVHVHEILMNLTTNALQAMTGKGGQLAIRLQACHLPESAAYRLRLDSGPYGVLSVSDTGMGIAEEHLPRIFDPFFTTKDVGKGTGLGLSVVHGLVTANRGAVEVSSRVGAGADFHIYLPLVPSLE
ncbi:MAG: PAS domain S-box protein [Magnetococcales bacterium]|nr:PAS domain S-box protein [Magnetococcales bacterium]MBF0116221.1 PAS domain S-box protein [Magnetococcales bacterium]